MQGEDSSAAASQSHSTTNTASASIALLNAVALHKGGRLEEAKAAYEALLKRNPQDSDALHYLGLIASRQKDYAAAIELIGAAIKINPHNPAFHCNLGSAYRGSKQLDLAITAFEEAIRLDPAFQAAYSNLGNTLLELCRYDEAAACYRKAIELKPDFAEAHYNLGNAFLEQYKLEEAISSYDRALAIKPDYPAAKYNKANALLCNGVSERVWQLYEARLQTSAYADLAECKLPLLGEKSPAGKKILIQWEQRYGDIIQMLRYAPMLEQVAASCFWQVAGPLRELVARNSPSYRIIGIDEYPQECDFRVPYTSLPLALQTFSEEAIPKNNPYLIANPDKVVLWKKKLPEDAGLRIGVIWRGNPKPANRSADISHFFPLLDDQHNYFVSLQKDMLESEAAILGKYGNMLMLDKEITSFDDTASVIAALDLVITIDTAAAHLAGALGKPVWVLLKYGADWRWLRDREDSPWYSTARLFRQTTLGDWSEVMHRIQVALLGKNNFECRDAS